MVSRRMAQLVAALVVVVAIAHASLLAWLSDDAFISFRYARNLANGLGPVFNAGERVEGYSNPLWTFGLAGALRVGLSAEATSIVGGIASYAFAIAALVWAHGAMGRRFESAPDSPLRLLPIAALIGALHPDWATFATSGLETSFFTTLVLGGSLLVLLGDAATVTRRAIFAGFLFGLASMTRHEGVIFSAMAGAVLLATPRRRWTALLAFSAAVLLLWVPFTLWRCSYYGQFFPNTYFAKSGGDAWWSVGLRYVFLYICRSWTVPLACLLVLAATYTSKHWRLALGPVCAGALLIACGYTLYIARVGGDFMFGRMLVPVTPLFLLALDAACLQVFAAPRLAKPFLAMAPVVALLQAFTPCPAPAEEADVVDERGYYNDTFVQGMKDDARAVTPYFQGVPARVAIYGSEARLAYLAPFTTVIEARAGLTDAHIAHQTLAKRGRVGHEKAATFDYLIGERKADITFSLFPEEAQGLDAYIPKVMADFGKAPGPTSTGRLLHWDPAIVAAWRSRGARIDDFPGGLDRLIASLDKMPDDAVRRELARCDHFYFDGGFDPARREMITRRLEPPRPTPSP